MRQISALLWGVVERESPDSVNYQVAHTLIDNLDRLHGTSSQRLADLCGVSKPTMSRFARELGFDDFYEFRLALEQYTPYRLARWDVGQHDSDQNPLALFAQEAQRNLDFLRDPATQGQIGRLAQDLHDYRASYLVGHMQSGDAASSLRYHLYHETDRIHFLKGGINHAPELSPLRAGTMLVVFSVTGTYLSSRHMESARLQKEPGSKVWLLTCDPYLRDVDGVDAVINTRTGDGCAGGNLSLSVLATSIALQYLAGE